MTGSPCCPVGKNSIGEIINFFFFLKMMQNVQSEAQCKLWTLGDADASCRPIDRDEEPTQRGKEVRRARLGGGMGTLDSA